jgi:hypothetical protein
MAGIKRILSPEEIQNYPDHVKSLGAADGGGQQP